MPLEKQGRLGEARASIAWHIFLHAASIEVRAVLLLLSFPIYPRFNDANPSIQSMLIYLSIDDYIYIFGTLLADSVRYPNARSDSCSH